MRSRHFLLALAVGLLCLVATSAVWAAVISGTIETVYPDRKKVVVKQEGNKPKETFSVPDAATITVDGNATKLADLKGGQQISVFTSSSGAVTRLVVRQEKEEGKPAVSPKADEAKPAYANKPAANNNPVVTNKPAANKIATDKRAAGKPAKETEVSQDSALGWVSLSHTLEGHIGGVYSVAFSPDGKQLASASEDQTIKLWDAATGKESRTLKGHAGGVYCVAFNPDGKWLASASEDQTVKLWDAAKGQVSLTLEGHTGAVYCVAFSADGTQLASASADQTVKLWDVVTGQESRTLKGNSVVRSVAYYPDGKRLAAACGGTAPVKVAKNPILPTRVSTENIDVGTVKVWDTTTGKELFTRVARAGAAHSVAISSDGKWLTSGNSEGTLTGWEAATGKESRLVKAHAGPALCVAFSPDGKLLASTSDYDPIDKDCPVELSGKRLRLGEVKVWDAVTGQESLTLAGHTSKVISVAFSPDGMRLASASWDKTVKVWAMSQESPSLKGHTDAVTSVAFSPDGKWLVSGSGDLPYQPNKPGQVKVWDVATGKESLKLKGHDRSVHSVAFSPDGKRLASASADETVKVWDATTGQESLTLRGHVGGATVVTFSPDGLRLASASADGTVKLWDSSTGEVSRILKAHDKTVHCVVFSSDGKRIASSASEFSGEVKVCDTATGGELLTLKGGAATVAFSPDGERLATNDENEVRVWNVAKGRKLLTLEASQIHNSMQVDFLSDLIQSVVFSPEGKQLVSGGKDFSLRDYFYGSRKNDIGLPHGVVKVWDAATGQELLTWECHNQRKVRSVAFSPDGKRLAASVGQTIKVWNLPPR